jgi:hypothetical protein
MIIRLPPVKEPVPTEKSLVICQSHRAGRIRIQGTIKSRPYLKDLAAAFPPLSDRT